MVKFNCTAIELKQWWIDSGLILKYSVDAMDMASANGHIDILDWWMRTNYYTEIILPLKYSINAIDNASANNHVNVLQW